MQFPFFGPDVTAFLALFTPVCERMKKVDHMLFGDRYFFSTVRLLLACCSHSDAPSIEPYTLFRNSNSDCVPTFFLMKFHYFGKKWTISRVGHNFPVRFW